MKSKQVSFIRLWSNTKFKYKSVVLFTMFTIEMKIWTKDKYGEPDRIEKFGQYYSKEAAELDMGKINAKSFWYVGFAKTETKVIESNSIKDK